MGIAHCPSANEFLFRFVGAFAECFPQSSDEKDHARQNWTAFMTGRFWDKDKKAVLRETAAKLKLKHEYEYLRLDMVLFPSGDPWGNFVVVEHENDINGFEDEIVKLMSVLAPLKVGITYGTARKEAKLLELIRRDFATRHPSNSEAPTTEYLFLLGVEEANGPTWKYLTFTSGAGPRRKQFEDACSAAHG
jgi:hypothetical protein